MKKALLIVFLAFDTVLVGLVVLYFVLVSSTDARIALTWEVTPSQIPVPYPLTADEVLALTAEIPEADEPAAEAEGSALAPAAPSPPRDVDAIALERALERGQHMAHTLGGCADCHAPDFGGSVIVEDPLLGAYRAPNITSGKGGVVEGYTTDDWVRIIRHGVNRDGSTSLMPALDFTNFSDREVSDVIAYMRQVPPVQREMPETTVGPLFRVLVAAGEFKLSAEHIDHAAERPRLPPMVAATPEYGGHLAQVCAGCHGDGFSGGAIPGGDPSWPPASNLTPHDTGLAGWAYEDFDRAMRQRVGRDGAELSAAMGPALMGLSDVEVEAMWVYFQSLDPAPFGSR